MPLRQSQWLTEYSSRPQNLYAISKHMECDMSIGVVGVKYGSFDLGRQNPDGLRSDYSFRH
eukprot:1984040-Pyramimonas_sp.AAC.1